MIVNYRRPSNIARVLLAFREQTVPVKVTLVDAAPSEPESAHKMMGQFDRYIRIYENHGAYNRYVTIPFLDKPFTLFFDDDQLPGPKLVETYLKESRHLEDFGVLGHVGRQFPITMDEYRAEDVPRGPDFTRVDLVIQSYFTRTEILPSILELRRRLHWPHTMEDDLLLAGAVNIVAKKKCYLLPANADPDTSFAPHDLSQEHAFCGRPEHFRNRSQFLKELERLGWTSRHRDR